MSIGAAKNPTLATLCLGALGVVYGDIGTSPLYTVGLIFGENLPLNHNNVFGILSLIFWSLVMVVTIKYVGFILRADNKGEGGIMALSALVARALLAQSKGPTILVTLAMLGTGLFYGDSMITPAISVLSAVEGLTIASPIFEGTAEPLAIVILTLLFILQRRGTSVVGRLFGPIILIWFLVLALLGIVQIARFPSILEALLPWHAVRFLISHGTQGFLILGSVVLAVTGAEALYADMGHFNRKSISLTWLFLALPALVLNYFGQGALLLHEPGALANPFYHMAPEWALYPMVALATAATIIASQAVISGAFSITYQAMQMGYCPRVTVLHTTASTKGQIYIPMVNWLLYAGVLLLILGFKNSSHLANAYGIAVTGTMAVTTTLFFIVMLSLWKWDRRLSLLFVACFLTIDLAFFMSTMVKFIHGGWFPIVIGLFVFVLMSTWKKGRDLLHRRTQQEAIPLKEFLDSLALAPPQKVPGLAVFLNANLGVVPRSFLHNLSHNKIMHEKVAFVTVITDDVPFVAEDNRLTVEKLTSSAYMVTLRIGFMDSINIPHQIAAAKLTGDEPFNILKTSFFLSRDTVIPSKMPGMYLWQEHLFAWMMRNAQGAMAFFRIPPGRVVELGSQIEI